MYVTWTRVQISDTGANLDVGFFIINLFGGVDLSANTGVTMRPTKCILRDIKYMFRLVKVNELKL